MASLVVGAPQVGVNLTEHFGYKCVPYYKCYYGTIITKREGSMLLYLRPFTPFTPLTSDNQCGHVL